MVSSYTLVGAIAIPINYTLLAVRTTDRNDLPTRVEIGSAIRYE